MQTCTHYYETKWNTSSEALFCHCEKIQYGFAYMSGSYRLKEIIRPVCNAQTMDDVIHKLQHAKYFAIFDTSKGFFHIPLDQESKLLTVIWHLAFMSTTS